MSRPPCSPGNNSNLRDFVNNSPKKIRSLREHSSSSKSILSSTNKLVDKENSNKLEDDDSKIVPSRKTFEERLQNYNLVRDRIFNSPEKKMSNRIKRTRERYKKRKEIRIAIDSSILDAEEDLRPYGTIEVFGEKLVGLIDTGANVSILGKEAIQFLEKHKVEMTKVAMKVRTAGGSCHNIVGKILCNVTFKGNSKEILIFIAPSLTQKLYLGNDFVRLFNLAPNLYVNELIGGSVEDQLDPNMHKLLPEERKALNKVIAEFPSFKVLGLGRTKLLEHKIDTGDNLPVKQRNYPYSPAIQKLLEEAADRMLKDGIIRESESSWNSPICPVIKPEKVRMCLDARKLNSVTKPFAYPMPIIGGLLSRLGETIYISSVDLKDAFWQIPLESSSCEKTAFSIPNRPLYEFVVMPFGLSNAAQRLCQLMDKVIPAQYRDRIFVYLDDLLVFSSTFEEHLSLLKLVAERLRFANLTINVEKSKFCFQELKYLGFVVGKGEIRTDANKVAAIKDFPLPRTVKQVRSFIGMANWYRRFIRDFSSISAPLTDCLKGKKGHKLVLGVEAKEAFEKLKTCLCEAPVLTNPDFSKEFIISCDACTSGVGGVLCQLDENQIERPICFYSHKLNKAQRNYSITELECLAAVMSIKFFRPYVEGHAFKVITDHASLRWLMSQKDLSGKLARWAIKMSQFQFTIEHRKGSLQTVPDALSRCFVDALETVAKPPIDLEAQSFQSEEYLELLKHIEQFKSSLPDVVTRDGIAYKRVKFYTGDISQETDCWKLWVPEGLRESVMENHHVPPNCSHGGYLKTLNRIRQSFFWPSMAAQIKLYVDRCEMCKAIKAPNKSLRPEMGKAFLVDRPFQHVYIDFLGPYPKTKEGHLYIFILLDQLTKYPLIKTMSKATSSNVVKFLNEIFSMFGVPESILSDNGSQFCSVLFKDFLKSLGINHLKTAFYAPQSNASERVNRMILSSIRAYIDECSHSKWNENLPGIMSSIRSGVHSAIGTTPYQALFGQPMILHSSSYKILRKLKALQDPEIEVENQSDKLQMLRMNIKKNIEKAHEKYVRQYNTRASVRTFNPGQEVMRRNTILSNAGDKISKKFAKQFIKCRVRRVVSKNMYELEDMTGREKGIFHGKDIFMI